MNDEVIIRTKREEDLENILLTHMRPEEQNVIYVCGQGWKTIFVHRVSGLGLPFSYETYGLKTRDFEEAL